MKTTFTYDTNATVPATYAQGRMTSAANDGYTWHLSYDIMGRVNKQTLQTAANTYVQAQYGYNTAGQVWNLYYPGTIAAAAGSVLPGRQYQYTYDATFIRALSLAWYDPGTATWVTRAQNAQYNAASQLTSWQEESGTPGFWNTLTRSYSDQRGWVTNIQALNPNNAALLNLTYGYLPNGRVSSVTDVVNPGQSVSSYEYDQLNRLTKATTPNWALQWTYDEFGNRLTQTNVPGSTGAPEINLSYGESTNRITTAGYTYDLNGNLTALPGLTTAYDVFDRAVTINSTTAKYDAFGRRIERVVSGTTRVFFYDMGGRLLAEYGIPSVGQGPTRRIEYFAGQRVGDYTDRTGNVRYTVYAGGGAWRHYYPFGEEITGTSSDTYKFADLYRDADTGLDYAANRYYSSSLGRFLTVDWYSGSMKLPSPRSFNRYSYVSNDPINSIDPSGLDEVVCTSFNGQVSCTYFGGSTGSGQPPPGGGGGSLNELAGGSDLFEVVQDTAGIDPPGGDIPTIPSDLTGLLNAATTALDALRNREDCRNLFKEASNPEDDFDPAALLQSLLNGGANGRISFANLGGRDSSGNVTSAEVSGVLGTNAQGQSIFVGGNIVINSNLAAPWFGGYPDRFGIGSGTQNIYRAMTLLHEFGHIVRLMRGGVAGLDLEPQSQPQRGIVSRRNTELVFNSCFR